MLRDEKGIPEPGAAIATLKPDICVLGAGSAGLTVAAAAAAFGASVVLLERDRMGGECLNSGCVPSKALLAAAKHAHAVREVARFGIKAGEPEIDFRRVHDSVQAAVAAIAPNDSAARFAGLGVRVIPRAGRFLDKRTMVAEGYEIRARRFVVAAGSAPLVPPIEGLDAVPYLTNETVFRLTRRPDHLLVVGGGPIGVEMAQAFGRLGARVTLLAGGGVLPRDDPELAARVRDALVAEGVTVLDGARAVTAARSGREQLRLSVRRGEALEEVEGTHLLIAAGRVPSVEGLGLRAAGVAYGRKGIEVDDRMRTTNPRIYAVGDVTGGPFFTHWAGHQAGLAVRSILFRFGGGIDRGLLTWATFTDPELAHVGLSEAKARERHGKIRILRWPFSENDRAQTERATAGLVKVIATKKGRIVGADIVGRQAGELIGLWALAIAKGLPIRSLTGLVLPYPTLSETARRVALDFYRPQLRNPWLRRLIRALRVFG